MKILLAVDGSECSVNAARKVVEEIARLKEAPGIEVLSVHLPIPHLPNMGHVIGKETIERFYREDCEQMLGPARKVLDDAGVRYEVRMLSGPVAETIAREADSTKCDRIVMGTNGRTALGSMLGSVAMRVLHLTKIPVLLVH